MNTVKGKVIACVLLAVISMCVLFNNSNIRIHALRSVENANVLKKQAEDVAEVYRTKIDSLVQANAELQQQVNSNAIALNHAKEVNKVLQQKVTVLTTSVETETDTPTKLVECDSLVIAVTELTVSNNIKDSFYMQMQTDLGAEVSNKDSIITLQQGSYNALQQSFFLSLASQDTLQHNFRLLDKQFHHQVFKKKFLSGALLTLSGITLYSLLRH